MNSKLSGTDTVVADTIISGYIDDACDLIDSRLYNLYTVPFTTTPLVIATITKNMALYDTLKGIYSLSTPEMNAWLESYRKKGEDLLDNIEHGKTPLIDTTGEHISNRTKAGLDSTTSDYKPVFDEGDAGGWEVSQPKIENEKQNYG